MTLKYVQYMLDCGTKLPLSDVLRKSGSDKFYEGVKEIHKMLRSKMDEFDGQLGGIEK